AQHRRDRESRTDRPRITAGTASRARTAHASPQDPRAGHGPPTHHRRIRESGTDRPRSTAGSAPDPHEKRPTVPTDTLLPLSYARSRRVSLSVMSEDFVMRMY